MSTVSATQKGGVHLCNQIAKEVGEELGVPIKPVHTTVWDDPSDNVHWMFIFGILQNENRIYRVQNGIEDYREISVPTNGEIDTDDVKQQIRDAIEAMTPS